MLTAEINDQRKPKFYIPAIYPPSMWENQIPVKGNYTYEDYEKLPEGAPYQLIGGKLVITPSPIPYRQELSRELGFKLFTFVKKNDLGHVYYAPLDVYFSETDVYQPDILFIHKKREKIIGKTKIEGSPDIVIEILSPSTAYYDLRKKFRIYEKFGVKEYWIVDPELKRIEVYENENSKYKIFSEAENEGSVSSAVLKGFEVELTELFGGRRTDGA